MMWRQMLVVIACALVSLFVAWMPWMLKIDNFWGIEFGGHGMETIVQNFDGLNYLAIAKTAYDPTLLSRDFAGFANSPIYYSAHFPLYPSMIKLFEIFMTGPQALLASIVASNILLAIGLYYFFSTFLQNKKLAQTLAIVALFFPARMLSVRMVGSSEPLFMFFVLCSLAFAYKKRAWPSAMMGALAVLTRSPGIFLFGAYALAIVVTHFGEWRQILKRIVPYLLMPGALVALFGFYGVQFGNFWAYFNSGSELHPVFFPPFTIFSNSAKWITEMWREDVVYTYLLYGAGIGFYWHKVGASASFARVAPVFWGVIYGLILLLIAHRDIGRYALPLFPIVLLATPEIFKHRASRWLMLLLIPIYLLGWQFVTANVQAISDWSPLL